MLESLYYDGTTDRVHKKIHPPHPKKLHHGEVLYTTVEDPDVGRYYKREFVVPCGYGLLVFNVGPAQIDMPYDLDVYDDGYVYSDNGGLCWLYPSYRAHQNDTEPFWMPDDPTEFHVPLGQELQKISTKVNHHDNTKDDERRSDRMKLRGGDYLVMAKHDFYTPRYYRQLKSVVNDWKVIDKRTIARTTDTDTTTTTTTTTTTSYVDEDNEDHDDDIEEMEQIKLLLEQALEEEIMMVLH